MNQLRFMTFNIRGSFWDDGINAWNNRAGLNIETIRRQAPDVIGFQEVQEGNTIAYNESLFDYDSFLGPKNGDLPLYDFNAIYWRKTKLECVDSGGFWLSRTPDSHSSDWQTACVRAVSWVRLRALKQGSEFIHINTHLDHISSMARLEGTKLIVERMKPFALESIPIVITGDFNCNPTSPAYRYLTESGYRDTYLDAGNSDYQNDYTFHGFKGHDYDPRLHHNMRRIDWILIYSRAAIVQTESCAIVRDEAPPVYPSDHYPVVADIVIGSY